MEKIKAGDRYLCEYKAFGNHGNFRRWHPIRKESGQLITSHTADLQLKIIKLTIDNDKLAMWLGIAGAVILSLFAYIMSTR